MNPLVAEDGAPPFLEVGSLLESSQPQPRVNWMWYVSGLFAVVVLAAFLVGRQYPALKDAVDFLTMLAVLALICLTPLAGVMQVRRLRADQQRVETAGELVQLRRWPEAALLLQDLLSAPTPTHSLRTQALIYLAAVLNRYHRFEDAIAVQNHLIEQAEMVAMEPGAALAVRLGRAMSMLRDDHLFDADRAISELRRMASPESAGLALIELYRDVKTGHPADGIDLFREKLPLIREQLGHRLGDAYGLVARAHDLLNQAGEAQDAFAKATLLAPPVELYRRYPEVEKLAGRYQPSIAPPEAG